MGRFCPGARFRIGDHEFSASTDTAEALKLLTRSVRTAQAAAPAATADWPLFRGSPSRDGSGSSEPGRVGPDARRVAADGRGDWTESLSQPRWHLKTFDEKDWLQAVGRPLFSAPGNATPYGGSPQPAASPSVQPLLVGNLVLLRTPLRLLAVDWTSGREVWRYPWRPAVEKPLPGPLGMDPSVKIQQRREDDVPWGQLSSDGRRVYLLDDLPLALDGPHGRAILAGAAFNLGGGTRGMASPNCRLLALDLRREGQLSWAVGGANGEDEPKLAGAMFLGPPVPDGPRLYVLAEIQGQILLCQLEASSGRLAWSQVVARPRADMLFDALRRLAGAAPSLAEGMIVCPTSSGAVVAVDAATHSLAWGFAYHLSPSQCGPVRWPVNVTAASISEAPRWVDAAAIISGRRVLVAPVDSDQLYCLDLMTGGEIWSCNRGGMLYLGCVHEGRVVLVGPREVTALRMSDRKPAWSPASLEIPSDGLSRGRGLCAGHFYYLPTSTKQLLAIDLDDGRLATAIKTDHVLGNLVGVRNCLISQSPDLLEVFEAAMDRPLSAE